MGDVLHDVKISGYYNPGLSVQPTFNWKGNSNSDYSFSYPTGLDKSWVQIIKLFVRQFHPFSEQNSDSNQVLSSEIPIQDTKMTASKLQSASNYDSDGTLRQSDQKYSFSLANQQIQSQSNVNLNFVVENNVQKSTTISGGAQLRRAQIILRRNTQTVTSEQLKSKRQATTQILVDQEPDIDPDLAKVQGKDTGVDPQYYFEHPDQYPGLKENDKLNLNIKNDAPLEAIVNSANVVTINESFVVVNQTKALHSATIFGKTLASQVYAFCELTILPSYTLNCVSKFIFNFLGVKKQVTIADFSRSISQSFYSNSNSQIGTLNFTTDVPLPYPLDYIFFQISGQINYYIYRYVYAGVYSYQYPYRYYYYTYYYPYGTIDASGTISIANLEAGAKMSGKLIDAYTDQYTRFSFYFITGYIQVYFNFWAHLYYFQYTWGYFWRHYQFFGGWTPYSKKQWTQGNNGYYNYKQLAYRTWTFSIYNQ